ncbi:MAG: isoprenylcysteine carboxylmethyltransferase family protein [Lachnospiraceae bacterium]|nr:isoprenylcysteine carboxylmethyltransferase family protein [Lachnospiraceae bacterium]
MSKQKLLLSALTKFLAGLVLMGLVLFLPAGTWNYFNAWLFLGLLFIPMLILGVVLFLKAPELLEKRLQSKEKESTQKGVVAASGLMFIGSFVLAGLDFRFGWTNVPAWVVILAAVILLASYGMYGEVMRENAYLSRTVEVQENQKVIDTGLYGVIRHPMYTATIFLFLAIPVVLGSWIAFAVMLLYPAAIIARIGNEEKVLEEGLQGYIEYKKKVKYRLVPFVW